MNVKIYHNPRCGKSRQTLQLLQEHGIQPDIIEYLKNPPNSNELAAILRLLNIGPRELMRSKEAEYKALGLDNPALTEAELLNALVSTPKLIERPIVLAHGKAAIGRPPEAVLAILSL